MSCQYKDQCPSYSGWCNGPKQDFSKCVEFLVTAYENEKKRMMPNEYQKLAMRTCSIPYDQKKDMLMHAVLGLTSEAGEVSGLFQKKYQGHKLDPEHLEKELGDCLWMIAEACTAKLHYVKVPENHIVIDFDIPDENGNKCFSRLEHGNGHADQHREAPGPISGGLRCRTQSASQSE